MKKKIEILIECGLTYQPLTIALSLLAEEYEIIKVHVLTTYSAIEAVEKVLETFFPKQLYSIYGELVDPAGAESDQAEYESNVKLAMSLIKHDAIAIIASGTNWMTWIFSRLILDFDIYVVKTQKAFEKKSFFPQNEKLAVSTCGKVGENCDSAPIVYLQKLYGEPKRQKLTIEGKKIKFLGREVELASQLAAMYGYLILHGGSIDLGVDHTKDFNLFCENNRAFDNERAVVDSFQARFRPNVSKINAVFENEHDLIKKHLTINRDKNAFFISGAGLIL